MIRLTAVVAMAAVASGVVSCGRSDGERIATPRPRAYPRIEVAESDYRRGDSLPSGFAVSSRAEAVLGGSGDNRWLTIVYPDYGGARLHLTFTVSDDPDAVSANRIERIALNAGQASLSASDTTVGGGMASITFFQMRRAFGDAASDDSALRHADGKRRADRIGQRSITRQSRAVA